MSFRRASPEQTTVAIGSEIELVISSGKESVDVPDVFGKSYAEAKQMLTDSGFVCTVAGNNTEGVVVSMSVEPGSKAPEGHAHRTYILDLERERRDELESELRRRFDTRPYTRPVKYCIEQKQPQQFRCGCFCILGRAVANTGIRLLRLSIHKVLAFFPTSRNIKIYFPAVLADRGLDFSAHFAAKNQALTSKIVATQESGNA